MCLFHCETFTCVPYTGLLQYDVEHLVMAQHRVTSNVHLNMHIQACGYQDDPKTIWYCMELDRNSFICSVLLLRYFISGK